jgi:hypothetical protein
MDTAVLTGLEEFMASEDSDPKIMKQVKAYQADSERAGGLLLQSQAAAILGITTPSLVNLVKTKKLDTFTHFGKNLVSADQVIAWGKLKSQGGNNDKAKRKAALWDATKKEIIGS